MSKIPQIYWHQEADRVHLAYQLMDAKDVTITFSGNEVDFAAKDGSGVQYGVKFECFKEIDPDNSSWDIFGREVRAKLKKKENDKWPRLLKSGNVHYVKANWAHDVYDSDDEQDEKSGGFGMDGMGDFDYSGMGDDYPQDDFCDPEESKEHSTSDEEVSQLEDKCREETSAVTSD